MEIIKFNSDDFEEQLSKVVVSPCRKGNFIYVECSNKKISVRVKKLLKELLSYKRGIFTWKGIVVVSTKKNVYTNFNIEVKIQ